MQFSFYTIVTYRQHKRWQCRVLRVHVVVYIDGHDNMPTRQTVNSTPYSTYISFRSRPGANLCLDGINKIADESRSPDWCHCILNLYDTTDIQIWTRVISTHPAVEMSSRSWNERVQMWQSATMHCRWVNKSAIASQPPRTSQFISLVSNII